MIIDQHTIDFDKWAELAKVDPAAFEELRSQFLANALNRVSKSKRLRFECMQWRIDKICQTTKTPLHACIKISELMWNSFDDLQNKYYENSNIESPNPSKAKKTATILEFLPVN